MGTASNARPATDVTGLASSVPPASVPCAHDPLEAQGDSAAPCRPGSIVHGQSAPVSGGGRSKDGDRPLLAMSLAESAARRAPDRVPLPPSNMLGASGGGGLLPVVEHLDFTAALLGLRLPFENVAFTHSNGPSRPNPTPAPCPPAPACRTVSPPSLGPSCLRRLIYVICSSPDAMPLSSVFLDSLALLAALTPPPPPPPPPPSMRTPSAVTGLAVLALGTLHTAGCLRAGL
eukprot:jgi/Ulvmu1/12282/UM087_0016.1